MSEFKKNSTFLNYKIHKTKAIAKTLSLPGFEGVPIYDVVKFFISSAKNGYLATKA